MNKRTPDMICRHEYKYGMKLDTLMPLGLGDQKVHPFVNEFKQVVTRGIIDSIDYEFLGLVGSEYTTKKLDDMGRATMEPIKSLTRECLIRPNTFVIVGDHQRAHRINALAREILPEMPFRRVSKGEDSGRIEVLPVAQVENKTWWGRLSVNDGGARPPPIPLPNKAVERSEKPLPAGQGSSEQYAKGIQYEPAFALTIDSFQGTTVHNETLILDMAGFNRYGTFYTAITRAKRPEQNVLLI